ncbi:unnamed protein product [Dibothriocephalus latus]|uniref:Reverse transcriptase domain-containing protein n=1 Tax=Dibothriocephalus latus TaxID=60516 RepID=A0A3P7LHS1_DIBLA|nr:unnamed protein product [Dibothriocephalus latus]
MPSGEVTNAIPGLGNKTRKEDGIPTEIYKFCVDKLVSWRFQAVHDPRVRPNQARCRAERECAHQILTLTHVLEFRYSYQQPTAICFVDFATAFDSVHR